MEHWCLFSTEFYILNSEIIQKGIYFFHEFFLLKWFIPTILITSRLEMAHWLVSFRHKILHCQKWYNPESLFSWNFVTERGRFWGPFPLSDCGVENQTLIAMFSDLKIGRLWRQFHNCLVEVNPRIFPTFTNIYVTLCEYIYDSKQ